MAAITARPGGEGCLVCTLEDVEPGVEGKAHGDEPAHAPGEGSGDGRQVDGPPVGGGEQGEGRGAALPW